MSVLEKRDLAALTEALNASSDVLTLFERATSRLGKLLDTSRVLIGTYDSHARPVRAPVEWARETRDPSLDSTTLSVSRSLLEIAAHNGGKLDVADVSAESALHPVITDLRTLNVVSLLVLTHALADGGWALIVVSECEEPRRWHADEVEVTARVIDLIKRFLSRGEASPRTDELQRTEARYRRLVEHSDAIIFHADSDHRITFVSRRALDFFGVAPEDFLSGTRNRWYDFVHPEDLDRVRMTLDQDRVEDSGFDEEFRVINRVTGRVRWVLMRLMPAVGKDGTLEGFDGFGIDISSRREAQDALDVQSKKIRALYTVSSAIRGYLDPSTIASRGIAALCDATGATTGLCYLFQGQRSDKFSLVAHHGFSDRFEQKEEVIANITGLARYVAQNGHSLFVADLESDSRVSSLITEEEGLRSLVFVPIATDEEILGTIGLLSPRRSHFDGGTVMLVSAAANQIGLAARQANLLALYQRQTRNLSALYRLSHELSRNLSVDEVFQNAFTIIRDELGLKRLWLGLLNESGTRIVGQAAYGPGWRRRLVEMNVEIEGREHPVARVVATRQPVAIEQAEDVMQEFGLRRIFSRMAIHSAVFVPLVAGGQVLGVLAAQPGMEDPALQEEEIALLSSLASEIAVTILTKRLESRIGEAEKMRTAGLLAAGIAHNFNNVLQAIMGQASLLEVQEPNAARLSKAANIIGEAAQKGAGLVKQLLSFAHLEEAHREVCDINSVLDRNRETFGRLLQSTHTLQYTLSGELPRAYVDSGQLLRIISTVISNAADSMPDGGSIDIATDGFRVDQANPHYDVPYGYYVRIAVRDHGSGMDEDTRRRCFEPFFTTKNIDIGSGLSISGAGLGLAAAYALARRNGGRLTVESQLGHGSVFTIYVPVSDQQSSSAIERVRNHNREEIPRALTEVIEREHLDMEEQEGVPVGVEWAEPVELASSDE